MIAWIVIIVFVVWMLVSAIILVSLCMMSARFNQLPSDLETYPLLEPAPLEDSAPNTLIFS